MEVVIQVNWKLRGKLILDASCLEDEDSVIKKALAEKKIQKYTEGGIKKTIFIKKAKLISFVVWF